MNTKELLGERIKDILVWSKMEVGGLDQGQVFIELTNGKTVSIPWDFESENIETKPIAKSESLVMKSSDKIRIESTEFNFPEGKTWKDVREDVKRNQNSTLFGRLKYKLGIKNEIPKKYKSKSTEIIDNEMKKFQNLKIVNFIMFEDYDSAGFLELENGNIITETITAPHGTGMAGLNIFENLKDFEESCGNEYKRLKNSC
ncbi:hypothetical protein LY01_02147 [Nonlabens xylanidelens]|uniref:Uncharacterized protein n=1 Tax=Nonlabens xylanidelens TaxID=191564 RepID=A0A2S6IIB4_9FLAO|nr:hypothetical protein [Nonlabens xylanidelens]PPK93925.1 hypothetical protein LY01_02147 [Nonlabens xylanidelens]PQJ22081.1 hypothetical protein BST94_00450 [Nonlabens xylanidelens]